jgi:signal transduction histidine kinase
MPPSNPEPLMDLTFKMVIDLLPIYVTIQDRELRYMFANQTFRHDFGDVVGRHCYFVVKGSQERCQRCPVQKTFEDKSVHTGEETIRLPDGNIQQVVLYTTPILDVMGNVTAVIELATNINTIKEMYKGLIFLGQSMAFLSHDIKNILEGLQGGVYVVDEGLSSKDMALAGKGWQIIKKNIAEITRVTQNILYSTTTRHPRLEKSSPQKLAREAVDLFQAKAGSLGIQLISLLNPELPMVAVDALSISRLLNNLIWNALEACCKSARKRRHAVVVRADFYDTHHFMLEVEDDADGIDSGIIENLFNPYFSTKGADGTGLGLVVADRIVRSHGGKIELLTKTGKGTLFRTIFSLSASMDGALEALGARDALNSQRGGGAYEENKS